MDLLLPQISQKRIGVASSNVLLPSMGKLDCYFGSKIGPVELTRKSHELVLKSAPSQKSQKESLIHRIKKSISQASKSIKARREQKNQKRLQNAQEKFFGRSVDRETVDPDKNFLGCLYTEPQEYEKEGLAAHIENMCIGKTGKQKAEFKKKIIELFETKKWSKEIALYITQSITVE